MLSFLDNDKVLGRESPLGGLTVIKRYARLEKTIKINGLI